MEKNSRVNEVDEDGKIFNSHLIYVNKTGKATEDQLRHVLINVLKEADMVTDLYVNVVHYKKEPCGYAYIWVSNTEAFDFLVGFEDNGFRVLNVPNPEYVKYNQSNLFDEEFGDPREFIEKSTVPQFTEKKYYLSVIEYTSEQIAYFKKLDEDWENEPVNIALGKGLIRDFRNDSEVEEGELRIYNKWVATGISEDITLDALSKSLRCFVTDPTVKGRFERDHKDKWIPYPHINFAKARDGKRCVYVVWNPNSTDGMFALNMARQHKLNVNGRSYILYFNHQSIRPKKE